MDSQTEGAKTRDTAKVVQAVLIAAIILSAAVVVYIFYSNSKEASAASGTEVSSGDSVKLNYIGRLADGRVFDTSLLKVAYDDIVYPKSLTFTMRSNESYTAFEMTAGNYGSGGTIKGFALGVIGMRVNETKIVEVLPEDGYAIDESQLETKALVEQVVATETIGISDFVSWFGVEPSLLLVVPHYFWGWDVQVMSNSSGLVKLQHMPQPNHVYYPYGDPDDPDDPMGWPVRVDAYDASGFGGLGSITIRNMIDQSDVYNIKGQDIEGNTFILWGFDSVNSTFVIHKSDAATGYNGEISGRTLYFEITIVSVVPVGD